MESDGEGLHGAAALGLHKRDDGTGINSSGKKRSERDIGNHAQADCFQEFGLKLIDRLRVRAVEPRTQSLSRYFLARPEGMRFGLACCRMAFNSEPNTKSPPTCP